jgi:hypothetical protein
MPPTDADETDEADATDATPAAAAARRRRKRSRIDVTIHPENGVTVTHTRHLRAVELDGAMLASEGVAHPNAPVWIQLAKIGTFAGRST